MVVTTKAKYIEAVGRRKTSVARVRITKAAKNELVINDKSLKDYLPTDELQKLCVKPLAYLGEAGEKYSVMVHVRGGGIHSQSEAIAHGLSRALASITPESRLTLKKAGALTRDSRMKERRKFGLKKARKSPQWSKR